MLITNQHSVHFGLFWFTSSIRFGSVYSNPLQFNQVHFVYFGQFNPIWFTSVFFSSLWSIPSNSVHYGLFGSFNLIRSILSTSVYLVHLLYFRSLRSNSVYLLKNGKIQVQIESTINYLSNINCNYMISFSYHNNLLKKMRNLNNNFET